MLKTITSHTQIIPDEYQNELIQIGEKVSENSFRIGDIANHCISINHLSGNDITNQNVYVAIAEFCGRQARTVRYYAEIALRYSPDIRQKYSEIKFDTFRFASRFSNWEEILEYAMTGIDLYGRPHTVDRLISQFGYPDEKEITSNSNILDLVNNLRKEVYKIPMSGDVRRLIIDALQRIIEAVQMTEVS